MKTIKGVSPLIAWVLLVGFSVTAGLLVTKWVIDEFSDFELPADQESYCNDVQIKLEDVCILSTAYNDTIRINLTNEGFFTVKRLNLGRATTSHSKEWCTMLNADLLPDTNSEKRLKLVQVIQNILALARQTVMMIYLEEYLSIRPII